MNEFRVWAPRAKKVQLRLNEKLTDMTAQERGWWTVEVDGLRGDEDYAYVLDGGQPLPDPRSPWQPASVHAASRLVQHDSFPWTDESWQPKPLSAAVIYELHVGTFTPEGTFEGAISRLEHLRDLGVTHVELMPVNSFPGAYGWGYDGVDLYAPFEAYGGPVGLKRLVDACHANGLAVLIDVVYNHLGPSGNYLDRFGPYFTERHRTPWGSALNFDGEGSDVVRRFVCDNAAMWLRDYHADGLRLDAVHAIYDFSARHILEQLADEVRVLAAGLGRHLVLIAESDLNDPRLVRTSESGGYGLHAQWSDDFHHALHALLTGERHGYYADFGSVAHLAKAFTDAFVYDGIYSGFRDRRHGRPVDALEGDRFVVSLQNHDQVGNRACGERITALVSLGRAKIGAALLLASPFVPMLFQGEEWGASAPFQYFTAHEEPELAKAVREGRRREFEAFAWQGEVPDPQDPATLQRSKLDWSELDRAPHANLLDWYRLLIALRREWPALSNPRLDSTRVSFDEEEQWLVIERGEVAIACNLSGEMRSIGLPSAPRRRVVAASDASVRLEDGAVALGPDAVALLGP